MAEKSEKRISEFLKYTFGPDEIRELGESLARATQSGLDLKDAKKSAAAQIQAEIAAVSKRTSELATKINNGYELREVECVAVLDTPRVGMKRIIRTDNNEKVRDEPMTMNEMQTGLDFAEPEK